MAAEKARKEEELTSSKKKCDELQMLKFGMLVDLDTLNTTSINHAAEEHPLEIKQRFIGFEMETELHAEAVTSVAVERILCASVSHSHPSKIPRLLRPR